MVIEPLDESRDDFDFTDVGDLVPRFLETPNVAMKEFTSSLV